MLRNIIVCTVILIIFVLASTLEASASICPKHTVEQRSIVLKAYSAGSPQDLGYSLAAIVIKESFVGPYVVKVNNTDGKYGSYGLTHVNLETAMWLEGYSNSWKAKQDLIPKLIHDDNYAFSVSLLKLLKHKSRGWEGMWSKYNGTGKKAKAYGKAVKSNVLMLMKCYSLGV